MIAVLRVHDYPSEYGEPIRFGDIVIVWSPRSADHQSVCFGRSILSFIAFALCPPALFGHTAATRVA